MRGSARVLAVALVMASLTAVPATATAQDRPGPCAIDRQDGQGVAAWVKGLIRCAATQWDIPGGATKAICVAKAESGLDPKATSADGKYLGLFQHDADAWPDRYDAWTQPSWQLDPSALNGRTNTIVSIRMVNADGWGPWHGAGDC